MSITVSEVDKIILDAKADRRKDDYRVYNDYKQKLGCVCTSSAEYEEACKRIARALRV